MVYLHTKVVLSALQSPKQVILGGRIGVGKFTVCEDNLQSSQVPHFEAGV